jgi:hypothetical protein
LILPLYLVLLASTYFMMERASAATFAQPLTRTDALYFTVTVFAMVGFGDITPESEAARVVLSGQMLGDLAILGVGIRILLRAVQHARRQRPEQAAALARPLPDGLPANSLAASSCAADTGPSPDREGEQGSPARLAGTQKRRI